MDEYEHEDYFEDAYYLPDSNDELIGELGWTDEAVHNYNFYKDYN